MSFWSKSATETNQTIYAIIICQIPNSLRINAAQLRACVYIYNRQFNSFRAPTLWFIDLLLLATFNTLFWVYVSCFHEKTDKTQKYSMSAIFVWYENSRRRLLGAQSINSERVSLTKLSVAYAFRRAFRSRSFIFKLVEMFLSVLDFVPWIMKRIIHLQRFHEELPNIYITFSKL